MFFRKQKPAVNDNQPEPAQPTRIGAETDIDGSVVSDGEVYVAGTLRGVVKAALCVVEERGLVEGEIEADEIIVTGRVVGPLRARHVHLEPGSRVDGDITSETIAVDNGARLSGAVWQSGGVGSVRARDADPPDAASNSSFKSESLWGARPNEIYRPLSAVRPQR
jgi:cytoskeletal protein CcmA (bactofilin family)